MSAQLSARLTKLKKQLFDSFFERKEWWGDDLTILDQEGVEKLPMTMRKAIAFEKVCLEMPIRILEDELIVGSTTMSSVGFGHTFPKYETDEEAAHFAELSLDRKSVWGHHLPYYPDVLSKGYTGIIREIDRELENIDPADQEGIDFLTSSKYCLKAACQLSLRYADLAEEKAKVEQDETRRAELLEIARICQKVPIYPADTFHEALQSCCTARCPIHRWAALTSICGPILSRKRALAPCPKNVPWI